MMTKFPLLVNDENKKLIFRENYSIFVRYRSNYGQEDKALQKFNKCNFLLVFVLKDERLNEE
jgi:hypothetical protein